MAPELELQVAAWDARGWPRPQIALVTGSALEVDLGDPLLPAVPLAAVVPFTIRAVEGHRLSFELYRTRADRVVLYFRGRLHCYQGFDPHQVAFPVRLAALLGAEVAILTNAAGSLERDLVPGMLAAIADHLGLGGASPLIGEPPRGWGERFPALNDAYDPRLRALARAVAGDQGVALHEGVYAWLLGPSYETPAEIRMLARAGATLVGMSTVPEVIALRQLGVACCALSLVTNLAAGLAPSLPSHQEVMVEGERAAARIGGLLRALLEHPELV
ncbi:MAG TPA: purine-nucleoside phosphorylase [Thermoanaerobaculia bacterium]|nr:purine-nucleoside phosphorylase [Thermoanaerobaculia bacterium]